jgi:hypothetical protein
VRLPAIAKELPELIEPEAVKSLNAIPDPEIDFAAPLMVAVPGPGWENVPEPLVEKFPDIEMFDPEAHPIPAPAIERLLKLLEPDPLMLLPTPVSVTVLVAPVKVPLLIQFPAT